MNLERVLSSGAEQHQAVEAAAAPCVVFLGIPPGSPQKALGKGGRAAGQLHAFLLPHFWVFSEWRVCEGRGLQEAELLRHRDSPALGIAGSAAAWQENPKPLRASQVALKGLSSASVLCHGRNRRFQCIWSSDCTNFPQIWFQNSPVFVKQHNYPSPC